MAEDLEPALWAAIEQLEAAGAKFALIGGLAVIARSAPRYTGDIDIAVSTDDAGAEQIVYGLQQAGYTLFAIMQDRRTKRLATVRTNSPVDGRIVDFMFSFSGIEDEIVKAATMVPVQGGRPARVAQLRDLIALKIQANRTKDLVDLENLERVATAADRRRALSPARKIMQRHSNDGRDLVGELRRRFANPPAEYPDFLEPVSWPRRKR